MDTYFGVVDFRDFWGLCDALRLLSRQGVLDAADRPTLQQWFRDFQDDLARKAAAAVSATNNIGALCDLLVASAAAYTGDAGRLSTTLARASLRIHGLIRPWGWQVAETSRATPLHYSLFGLQALINLAWIGRHSGIDLWSYAGINHRSIPMAARFIAVNRGLFSDYARSADLFDARIEAALRSIPQDAADFAVIANLDRGSITPVGALNADHGFVPWWPIMLATDAEATSLRSTLPRVQRAS